MSVGPPASTIARLFNEQRRAVAFLANARVAVASASFGWAEAAREFTLLGKLYNRLSPTDLKQQMNNALSGVDAALERCAPQGEIGRRLSAGLTSPQAYADVINAAMSTVSEVLRSVDSSRFSGENLWRAVVVPTLEEAKDVAVNLADRGQSLASTLAVIAVAVAVVYVVSKVTR